MEATNSSKYKTFIVSSNHQTFHRLLYKRAGVALEVKKNIREFSGFHYADNDARQSMYDKVSKLFTAQLKDISALFGLQVSGTKDALVEALVEYLDAPWDTKKPVTKVRGKIISIDMVGEKKILR